VLLINCEQLELGAVPVPSPSVVCVELGVVPEPSPSVAKTELLIVKVKKKVLLV